MDIPPSGPIGWLNSPTAAALRVVIMIRPNTMIMLSAHATILAMFPSDPSEPRLRIPHSGLTPTGADVGFVDRPVRVALEWRCS